jgi:hypothetical protein
MVKTISVSPVRLVREPCGCSTGGAARRVRTIVPAPALKTAAAPILSVRPVAAADLPWVQAWSTQLGLPAPRSRRVRSFMLLKDQERIGYLSARDSLLDVGNGREPMMWIVAAFLTPAHRGQGLILKFGEILSRDYYRCGRVGARIAADNARMHKIMETGRWRKLRTTRRFTDYALDLNAPYRAVRRR